MTEVRVRVLAEKQLILKGKEFNSGSIFTAALPQVAEWKKESFLENTIYLHTAKRIDIDKDRWVDR